MGKLVPVGILTKKLLLQRTVDGGTLDTSKITKFAIWCNSIVPEGHEGKFHVESNIYFDGIKAVKASKKLLKEGNQDGLIYKKSSK